MHQFEVSVCWNIENLVDSNDILLNIPLILVTLDHKVDERDQIEWRARGDKNEMD